MLARRLPNESQSDDARYLHRIHQLTHGHLHTLHQLVANQSGILPSPEVRTPDSVNISMTLCDASEPSMPPLKSLVNRTRYQDTPNSLLSPPGLDLGYIPPLPDIPTCRCRGSLGKVFNAKVT